MQATTDRITRSDISAERVPSSGAWLLATVHNGHRVHMQYYSYTKQEAIRQFLLYVNHSS